MSSQIEAQRGDEGAVEDRLVRYFTDHLAIDPPEPDEELLESQILDSLSFVRLVAYLSDEFGVRLDLSGLDMERFRTVRAIGELVREEMGEALEPPGMESAGEVATSVDLDSSLGAPCAGHDPSVAHGPSSPDEPRGHGFSSASSAVVRPVRAEDIPDLARLHGRVWGAWGMSDPELLEAYRRLFPPLFLNPPERVPGIESLVVEDDGVVRGFLGVLSRPMQVGSREVTMAVTTMLAMDPDYHSPGAALEMQRRVFEGSQDVTVADMANQGAQDIWLTLGGFKAPLYSLHWVRTLRPGTHGMAWLRNRTGSFAGLGAPLAKIVDALARRVAPHAFGTTPGDLSPGPLRAEHLLEVIPQLVRETVRPVYREAWADWTMARLANTFLGGEPRGILLTDERGSVVGSYVYQVVPGGVGQVAQVVAAPGRGTDVLEHLFHDAWSHGLAGLAGRAHPALLDSLGEVGCVLHTRGDWAVVHSEDPDLVSAFKSGDVFLSRLEGEGSINMVITAEQACTLG